MRPLIIIIAGFLSSPLIADEVFRWTDDNGVVHYSQWMPEKMEGVTRVTIRRSLPRDYDPIEDPYSIRNQAARMRETWNKTVARREEREKQREEEAARRPLVQYYPYYEPYPNYNYRPILRPPVHLPIYPPHGPRYPNKIQSRQISGMQKYNRQPHTKLPYSSVTGVSQRATIHQSPVVSPLSGQRPR
jgi:hypothetical protein